MNFKVQVETSGHSFTVEAEETVLDAALRQGIGLPYGCRNGQCGTCAGTLLAGRVDYPSGKTAGLEGKGADACLLCQAVPASDLRVEVQEVEQPEEIVIQTLPCKIHQKQRLNHDVMRLYLKLPESQRLQYIAGQYLDFILDDGRRRAFSIANAPHDDQYIELHIRHVDGGKFTDYVFNEMQEQAILRIQAPLGQFFLREDSPRPLIFMGGGTGFAPLKAIVEHAFHIGIKNPMHLYWGVRSKRDLYLPDLPYSWVERHPGFRYTPVLSEAARDWTGRTGFVHQAVIADYPNLADYDVYMSGPPVMVEAGRDAFLQHGLAAEHMFSDAFEYALDKLPAQEARG